MINRRGFTLIEVIVTVAVIAILVTIVTLGLNRYLQDGRDSQRESNAAAIAESLERYYNTSGEYPSCSAVSGSADAVANVLEGIDKAILVAPQAPSSEENSIKCRANGNTLTANSADFFEYNGDDSVSCNGAGACLRFTLRYREEASGEIKTINSRRSATLETSGISTLSASTVTFTTINLSWTNVPNSQGYVLQRSTNASFSGEISTSYTSYGTTVESLSPGTTYYFRVAPTNNGVTGAWSNTINRTTLSLTQPTMTATTNSPTQITASWGAVANAVSYTLSYSTSSSFATQTTLPGLAGTSRVITGLTPGTTYYLRVMAVASGATSTWSATVNTRTTVAAPAAYSISASKTWNMTYGTSNAVCTHGTPEYRWTANGSLWLNGTQYRSVSYQFSDWNQSVTLAVQTRCVVNGVYSGYTAANNTSSNSLIRPIVHAANTSLRTVSWWGSCPEYTTWVTYHWRVNAQGWGASGWTNNAGSYSNQAGWGDGNVRATLYCDGPWGQITAEGWGPFGAGCVPTITNPGRCHAG